MPLLFVNICRLQKTGGMLALLYALMLTNSCMLIGPDYEPPQTEGDLDNWKSAGFAGLDTVTPELSEWWEKLNDPILNDLIDSALTANLDLEQARSRVREARARRGIETAARFPFIDTRGAAEKTKDGTASSSELYNAGFDASWELDIFGGVTRRIEAATADLEALAEARRNVRISLSAELALNYVEYRSLQRRLELARGNVETQKKTLELVKIRHEGGVAKRLEVEQATTNIEISRARIPPLETARQRAAHRLAVLIGKRPGQVAARLIPEKPVPHPPSHIVVGIPADLLRRRPDIRRAERELAAQSARVGVAVADLYPRFTLNGNLQFAATDFSNLLDNTSRLARIGPAFSWDIFSGGSIRSNIEVQNEKQKQALLHYEQTILLALEEVENAMTSFAHELQRRQALKNAEAAAQNNVEQAWGQLNEWLEMLENPEGYSELHRLRKEFDSIEGKMEQCKSKLSKLLSQHDENREQLQAIFSRAVQTVLPSKVYDGVVSLKDRELSFAITRGTTMNGEAVGTLAVLLADIASVVYYSVCENVHLPGLMLHDSPREADLGLGLYRRFLRFIASLHAHFSGTDSCPFQYIITTTTPPPKELQCDEFVKLSLDAGRENDLLFRRNFDQPLPNPQDELFGES